MPQRVLSPLERKKFKPRPEQIPEYAPGLHHFCVFPMFKPISGIQKITDFLQKPQIAEVSPSIK